MKSGDPSQSLGISVVPRFISDNHYGTPNIVAREAYFSLFHKLSASGDDFVHSHQYLDDAADEWWSVWKKVLGSTTGSPTAITKTDFLSYMRALVNAHSIRCNILALKMIVEMDWEAVYGEKVPFELRYIRDRLDLDEYSFDKRYGYLFSRLANCPAPPLLLETLADFFSPFTMNERDNTIYLNVINTTWFVPDSDQMGAVASQLTADLFTMEVTNSSVYQVLTNWLPWAPVTVYPQYDHMDRAKVLGWKNSYTDTNRS